MYIFLKCVKYHHCRTLQISMLLLYSHGSIYTINDYSSHSNYEIFGIPLFVGPFSQGFSLVCSQPTLRTSRLFLSLQSISVCLFPFEYNPFITHWSKNCRERHSQEIGRASCALPINTRFVSLICAFSLFIMKQQQKLSSFIYAKENDS